MSGFDTEVQAIREVEFKQLKTRRWHKVMEVARVGRHIFLRAADRDSKVVYTTDGALCRPFHRASLRRYNESAQALVYLGLVSQEELDIAQAEAQREYLACEAEWGLTFLQKQLAKLGVKLTKPQLKKLNHVKNTGSLK